MHYWFRDWYRSTPGKKMVMALTGVLLFLFVLGHFLGNLQILIPDGGDSINAYGRFLHSKPALLWVVRAVLGGAVLLHVLASVQLWWRSRQARPIGYCRRRYREADLASRTMILSGPIIGLFVTWHVLHLTVGQVGPDLMQVAWPDGAVSLDVYRNVIRGFQVPWLAAFYMGCMVLLGVHFYHGLWSWMQTLGWSHPAHDRARRIVASTLAIGLAAGNCLIPTLVLCGAITEGRIG